MDAPEEDPLTVLCVVCQRRRPHWPMVCEPCRSRTREQLTVDLPEQYAMLDATPGQSTGQRVSGTRTAPLPGRLDVLNLVGRGTLRVHDPAPDAPDWQIGEIPPLVWLDQWVRDWRDTLAIGAHLPPARLMDMVRWLDHRLDTAMDEHPAIDSFAAELAEQVTTLRAVNGDRSDWRRIGTCPGLRSDGVTAVGCGTPLYANPWVDVIQCRGCGYRWDRHQWGWLGQVLRDTERTGGAA